MNNLPSSLYCHQMEAHICKPLRQAIGNPTPTRDNGRVPAAAPKGTVPHTCRSFAASSTTTHLYMGVAATLALIAVGAMVASKGSAGKGGASKGA